MKRTIVSVVALSTAMSGFAYYSSYSDDSGILQFVSIITIVGGILEIILFFKIWGMTNDIRALKEDHFNEKINQTSETVRQLRQNLILGNKENVKRIFLRNFIQDVERKYYSMPSQRDYIEENGKQIFVNLEEENRKISIVPYIEKLQKQFEKINEVVPEYILNMKTTGDYFDLITEEDISGDINDKQTVQ